MTTETITDTFDVLCGRLLGNHNDLHWQLGGQINHQPCSYKAARVIRCTASGTCERCKAARVIRWTASGTIIRCKAARVIRCTAIGQMGPPRSGGGLCICTLCTFLRPLLHLSVGVHLNSGKKKCSIFWKDLFFGLHLICSPEQNCGRGSSPQY